MKTNEKEALKNKTVAELNEALAKAQEKKFNLLFNNITYSSLDIFAIITKKRTKINTLCIFNL